MHHDNGHGPPLLNRLAVADAPFAATGVAHIKATKGGKEQTWGLPIKSVALEDVDAVVTHLRPKVPTFRDNVKGRWITVVDEANAAYQQALGTFQRTVSYAWVLMALDVDVVDASGLVVWSADNTVRQLDEAVAALKAMGLVDGQLVDIFKAVQALTSTVEAVTDQD